MTIENSINAAQQRRVWLKAFWGFDPKQEGYLGFTRPGDREHFISSFEPGDLVLIYGAESEHTAAKDRRQALGFLEVEPIRIKDTERMSAKGCERKGAMKCENRWTHAVPVRRAWQINRRIEVGHIADMTYTPSRARVIASRGEILSEAEAARALALPVVPVDVFGESPLDERSSAEETMNALLSPSRGVTPIFGKREAEYEDGEAYLYMLRYEGNASALLGREAYSVGKKIIVKVGYSNDPEARCKAHNDHLPIGARSHWRVLLRSRPFASGLNAKEAEDELKTRFKTKFESLGREFFLGEESLMQAEFAAASRATAFVMHAPAIRE